MTARRHRHPTLMADLLRAAARLPEVTDAGQAQRILAAHQVIYGLTSEVHPENPNPRPADTFHGETRPLAILEPQAHVPIGGEAGPNPARNTRLPHRNPPEVYWPEEF